MIHLYYTRVLLVLIIIPCMVDSFFLGNVANLNATQQISCTLSENGTSSGGFQVCAIRAYSGLIGETLTTINVYNGLRYVNTFTQFIQLRCPTNVDTWGQNVGNGICDQTQSYETFGSVQLCMCATDNCNQNLATCQRSANTITSYQLSNLIPSLTTTVQCQDTLNASNICTEHPFIDISLCQEYVKNNSVLCAITIQGTQPIQTSLIYDSYAAFLDEQIYEVKLAISNGAIPAYNETDTNVYYRYFSNQLVPISTEECVCAKYSSCNQDINTCLSQSAVAVQSITTSASVTSTNSIGTSGSISASISSSNSVATSGSTSASISSTNSIATSAITSMNPAITSAMGISDSSSMTPTTTNSIRTSAITSMNPAITSAMGISDTSSMTPTTTNSIATSAITSMNPVITNAIGVSDSSSITPTTTNSIATSGVTSMNPAITNAMGISDSSSMTPTTTNSIGTSAITSMNSATSNVMGASASMTNSVPIISSDSSPIASSSSTTVQPPPATATSNGQSPVAGESGIGRAATAGIACGIIFTTAIVVAEVVYFKFFFAGASRASAYGV